MNQGTFTTVADPRKSVTTNDGVTLRYEEVGFEGKPVLVCIPGWSQTAAQFKKQFGDLALHYRVIAVDMRGHGESDKPDNGYTIQRLAKDVQDVLVSLKLTDVTLMGHSMGNSVIWCYWQLWGRDRLSKLIFVDEPPMVTADPGWSPQEKEDAGAIFDPMSLYTTIHQLAGPDGVKTTEQFISGMFTKGFWRPVIPKITLPTLVVAGKASVVPWKSQVWIRKQVRGSRIEIFEENEGGSHFMFMENPDKFNRIVREFIG